LFTDSDEARGDHPPSFDGSLPRVSARRVVASDSLRSAPATTIAHAIEFFLLGHFRLRSDLIRLPAGANPRGPEHYAGDPILPARQFTNEQPTKPSEERSMSSIRLGLKYVGTKS